MTPLRASGRYWIVGVNTTRAGSATRHEESKTLFWYVCEGLTGDFKDGRGMLGSSDAIGDLADVRSSVLRLDWRDDEGALGLDCYPTLGEER